jgi:cytochrome c oxidase subunit 3
MEQQREAGSIGMWVFLVQEIMFFGGLFLAYSIFRAKFPEAFAAASNHLNWKLGGVNTVVLIVSSLTMALAVYYAQTGKRRQQVWFLTVTMLLGATFLVIKGFEYAEKFRDNLFPGPSFHWTGHGDPNQVQMFFWIYFAMTGLHALHMIIGIGIIAYLIFYARRGRFTPEYHSPVEISGLYWHFVDIVWIFLFPLLYLLGRHLGE